MSSTDSRTVDPAQPHHDGGGHELSDFSWTTVLWLLPLSVVILVTFFAVCISWFKGAKDSELAEKQAMLVNTELNQLHAKENEILNSYKWLDKEKGRVQIPIARAMELLAKENEGSTGREWKPITDTYLEGAAFADKTPAKDESGISIGDAETKLAPKAKAKAAKKPAEKKSEAQAPGKK